MAKLHFRLDLDKTYLATPLEHKLQLIKAPFENPESKRTLPGMAALVRGIREAPGQNAEASQIAILSASPSFMAKQLRAKLSLDGVSVDHFVFKDQWDLVKKGRFKEIGDPFAYKLGALCKLAAHVGDDDSEVLVGDDYDMDPIIYAMYNELRQERVAPATLQHYFDLRDTRPEVRDQIWRLLDGLPRRRRQAHIFIRQDRRLPSEFYDALGHAAYVYDDAFQLALLLFDDDLISGDAVAAVANELKSRRWRHTAFAFSWRGLTERHYLERHAEAERLVEALELLPKPTLLEKLATPPFIFRGIERRAPKAADWDKVHALFVRYHPQKHKQ